MGVAGPRRISRAPEGSVPQQQGGSARGEASLVQELKSRAGEAESRATRPATMKDLFEFYVGDLQARGKGPDSVGRAIETARAMELLTPDLLEVPVGRISDKDIFAFREARERDGAKPSTVNRDFRTLRAALKKARPDYHFPSGAFFPEDETRVRWLRPDEEILVIEPMRSPFKEMSKLAALTLMRQGEIRLYAGNVFTWSRESSCCPVRKAAPAR